VSFDAVFTETKAIHDTLDVEETNLSEASEEVYDTAGGGSLESSLNTIASASKGNISLSSGSKVQVRCDSSASSQASKSCDALNKLLAAADSAKTTSDACLPQVQALIKTASAFPSQIEKMDVSSARKAELKSLINQNNQDLAKLLQQTEQLKKRANSIVAAIKAAFS
jgi:hypothetical protein